MVDEYDPKICAEVFQTFARNGTYITPTHGTRRMDAFADNPEYRRDSGMKYIPLPQQMNWLLDADPALLRGQGVEFLSKPYTQAQLAAAIGRALGRDETVAQGA